MNIISKLTLRHLRENKKRTVVTILGIATSTALISGILMGVFSFFRFFGYLATRTDGNVHAAFYELTQEQARMLKADERIAVAGVSDRDPEISGVRLENGKEPRLSTGNIDHGDADYYSVMVLSEYEGRLPENASEIAVEEQFLADNGLSLQPGDRLRFTQGYRYTYDENNEKVYLAGNYRSNESFESLSEEECTVTAILHGNRPTEAYDILRGMDEGSFPALKDSEVRISLKNCNHTAIKQIRAIAAETGIAKCALNTEYMLSVFAFEGSSGAYRAFFYLMAIALLIVVVTSVVLIVNSIGMSLAERLRYLGMLASVGATGRQKRFSVYFEGFILGAVGIPLGILLGYIGTKVTLSVMGKWILDLEILAGAEGLRGSIPVSCSPAVILVIVLCAALTIFLSTLSPALRAAKVTPIDALRQSNTIRVKAGKLRINPLIRKLFGYEGELAYKNIKRNGIKGTVITLSIAISVIMFLCINFFSDSVERVNQYEFDLPCQLIVSCALSESEALRNELEQLEGVDRVFGGGMIEFRFRKKEKEKISLANTDIADPAFLNPGYEGLELDGMALVIADDGDFEKILADNGLKHEKYFGDTLRGVLVNDYFRDDLSGAVFDPAILGQSLHYDEAEGNPPAVEIGDLVRYDEEHFIYRMTPKGTMTVFVPASVYYEKAKETLPEENLSFDLCVVTKQHEEVTQRIYGVLENGGYRDYSISDMADSVALMNMISMMLKTVMYGFTILLTLIAIANIINTISTGVLLRRKEFAMYKSVGMEAGGIRKMLRLEACLYGIRALVFAIPASLLLSYLMYSTLDQRLYAFDPDGPMYLLVIAAVFAIVGLSMLLSVSRIRDDSIIEALRCDGV
ncbi:MAG: ABC transporter permease [Lachnospiraceae bacterium]|nr:ABC transporter permease [Lachnospiraceae bacterium]